jgi:protein MAK16
MQHDEMIWQVINNQFCSFKTTIGGAKSEKRDFCRHPYSVTGLCNRSSCPLANSRYATVREENGKVSLYLKTVERAHSPKNLWERITLSRNYTKALAQLDEHLAYWPKNLIHRNKQRLTKIHQYLIRMRKLKLKELAGKKAKMIGINRKIDQREERREKKALVAAKIENSIEKELLERLSRGVYGDLYNYPEAPFVKALESAGKAEDEEKEEEMESEEEEELEEDGRVEYVEDFDDEEEDYDDMEDMEYAGEGQWQQHSDESEEEDSEEEDSSEEGSGSDESSDEDSDEEDSGKRPRKRRPKDDYDDAAAAKKKKKGRKDAARPRKRIEIEYEEELEEEQAQEEAAAGMAW